MSTVTVEAFLTNMKELIRLGKRHFVRRNRNGLTYVQQLAILRIASVEEAWECVLQLETGNFHSGPSYDYGDPEPRERVLWVFKVEINNVLTYIKLKDETALRGCVCLSFHEDN